MRKSSNIIVLTFVLCQLLENFANNLQRITSVNYHYNKFNTYHMCTSEHNTENKEMHNAWL